MASETNPLLGGVVFNVIRVHIVYKSGCGKTFVGAMTIPPEEVGHASFIVTRCLVIMAKIKRN